MMPTLANYHHYHSIASPLGSLYSKQGVKGFPRLQPALTFLLSQLKTPSLQAEQLVDLSDSGGIGLLSSAQAVTVAGTSRASLRCAEKNRSQHENATIKAAASWQLEPASCDVLWLLPGSDKGTARVRADLQGAARALQKDGVAYVVMHKDQGAKRYEKIAKELFGMLELIGKEAGWRLCKLTKRLDDHHSLSPETFTAQDFMAQDFMAQTFVARGLELQAAAGVFAAGKLDKGSDFLLTSLDIASYQGKSVLDIGCGYGMLSLELARAGAQVTALDDDWLAVESCRANAARHQLDIRVHHSDVNSALDANETFDAVVMNPPFHLGKQVLFDVPLAFLAAAYQHLEVGGHMTLVANRALPYEAALAGWAKWCELERSSAFKVLRAWR